MSEEGLEPPTHADCDSGVFWRYAVVVGAGEHGGGHVRASGAVLVRSAERLGRRMSKTRLSHQRRCTRATEARVSRLPRPRSRRARRRAALERRDRAADHPADLRATVLHLAVSMFVGRRVARASGQPRPDRTETHLARVELQPGCGICLVDKGNRQNSLAPAYSRACSKEMTDLMTAPRSMAANASWTSLSLIVWLTIASRSSRPSRDRSAR